MVVLYSHPPELLINDSIGKEPDPDIDWNDIYTLATYNAQGLNLNNLEPIRQRTKRQLPIRTNNKKQRRAPPPPLPPIEIEPDKNAHELSSILNVSHDHRVDVLALQHITVAGKKASRHVNYCLNDHTATIHTGLQSESTALLSHNKTSGALVNRWKGFNGRVVSQTFSVGPTSKSRTHTRIVILCVYGPPGSYKERNVFFSKLIVKITKLQKQKKLVIVMGDLNLAPATHDRTSGKDNNKERSLFSNLLERTGLIDSFREVNPAEASPPAYSYHRHTSPPASSRIDQF